MQFILTFFFLLQIQIFHDREETLQRKIDVSIQEAKTKMAKKDKKGAMYALRRKKLFDDEMEKILNIKMTLEAQVMNIESTTQNADALNSMNNGSDVMKKIQSRYSDKVDDLMDEIKEEMDVSKEISVTMTFISDSYDEDELLGELAEMEQVLPKDDKLTSLEKLPDISVITLPSPKSEEIKELKKLEVEVA